MKLHVLLNEFLGFFSVMWIRYQVFWDVTQSQIPEDLIPQVLLCLYHRKHCYVLAIP
jgi:hypothetical protein